MIRPAHGGPGPLFFCYAKPDGFSGQKAATEIVLHGLAARGWDCRELAQPVLDRGRGSGAFFRYLGEMLSTWLQSFRLLGSWGGGLWVGLGQTRASFVRDGVPLLLGRLGLGRSRVIVSLNGSLFMHWPERSLEARIFRFLLDQAGSVVVVGHRQRERLLALGVPAARAKVVVNTCALEPLATTALESKLATPVEDHRVVRVLHLSSLIDTKGFPEYLEALLRLSLEQGRRVEAVLCGRLVASEFSSRFRDENSAIAWIEARMAEINRSARVSVRWVKGAAGADKEALFREADIFVLPTYYAVEAQPLVLLEAMASGCAIITTQVAEIPTILNGECAVFVKPASSSDLARVLDYLVSDAEVRARLAEEAHARFVAHFQTGCHIDAWEDILQPIPRTPGKII